MRTLVPAGATGRSVSSIVKNTDGVRRLLNRRNNLELSVRLDPGLMRVPSRFANKFDGAAMGYTACSQLLDLLLAPVAEGSAGSPPFSRRFCLPRAAQRCVTPGAGTTVELHAGGPDETQKVEVPKRHGQ
jgi:hypothetical protein